MTTIGGRHHALPDLLPDPRPPRPPCALPCGRGCPTAPPWGCLLPPRRDSWVGRRTHLSRGDATLLSSHAGRPGPGDRHNRPHASQTAAAGLRARPPNPGSQPTATTAASPTLTLRQISGMTSHQNCCGRVWVGGCGIPSISPRATTRQPGGTARRRTCRLCRGQPRAAVWSGFARSTGCHTHLSARSTLGPSPSRRTSEVVRNPEKHRERSSQSTLLYHPLAQAAKHASPTTSWTVSRIL